MIRSLPFVTVLFVILSFLTPFNTPAQKVNLTEYQKKEKERLKKNRESNKKSSSFNNNSLKKIAKERKKNPEDKNKKTVVTDRGKITIEEPDVLELASRELNNNRFSNRSVTIFKNFMENLQASVIGSYFITILIFTTLFYLIVTWRIFNKAGYPGIYSIIPLLNTYIMIKIAGRSGIWVLFLFIPVINFFILILINIDIARNFGKSGVFGLGMVFFGFIFYPILAFDSSEYMDSSIPQY